MSVSVLGCGWTGSEVVGCLLDNKYTSIFAIDAFQRPISSIHSNTSNKILSLWKSSNINVFMNHKVSSISHNNIKFDNNIEIPYDIAIWCGGIKPTTLTKSIMKNNDNYPGITINNYLQVLNNNIPLHNVYAIGDCSYMKDNPLPPTAQVAYQQGKYLANQFNYKKEYTYTNKKAFTWNNKGQIGYIGSENGIYSGKNFEWFGKSVYYINDIFHFFRLQTIHYGV